MVMTAVYDCPQRDATSIVRWGVSVGRSKIALCMTGAATPVARSVNVRKKLYNTNKSSKIGLFIPVGTAH